MDGRIGLGDLQAVDGLVDSSEYAYVLLDTAAGKGSRDGYISRNDFMAALSDPGIPPEIREQIVEILGDNPQVHLPPVFGGGGIRY